MFFILGGVSGCPLYVHTPPVCPYAPHRCTHPHVTHTPLCICMFSEAFACCGGVRGSLMCWTLPLHHPYMGVPPLQLHSHTQLLASLCISIFWGYLYVMWAVYPSIGGLRVFPHQYGVLGAHQHLWWPYTHSCAFL